MMRINVTKKVFLLLLTLSILSGCAIKDEDAINVLSAQLASQVLENVTIEEGTSLEDETGSKPENLASEQVLNLSGRYFYGFDSSYFTASNWKVINNTNIGLTRFDSDTEAFLPALAENWIMSADKLTWIFTIKENIPWVFYDEESGNAKQVLDTNGDVRFVSAKDVKANFTRVLDTYGQFYASEILFPVLNVEAYVNGEVGIEDVGVKAVDDSTLVIQLEHPASYIPAIVETPCFGAYPAWIDQDDAEFEPDEFYRYSYGPFVVKTYEERENLSLINNSYWQGSQGVPEAILEEIRFDLTSRQDIFENFDEGMLDAAQIYVYADDYADIVEAGKYKQFIQQSPGRCGYYLLINNGEGNVFIDPDMRTALAKSVNRQEIIDQVYFGSAASLVGFTSDSLHPMPSGSASDGISMNLQSAKKALAAMDDSFTLYSIENSEQDDIVHLLHKQIQEALQENFSLKDYEFDEFSEEVLSSTKSNLVLLKECASFADAHALWNLWDQSAMYGNLNDVPDLKDKVTDLLADANEEYDPEKRAKIYAQLNELVVSENVMVIPLVWLDDMWLAKDEVHMGTYPIYPQFENWWIEK